MLNGFVKVRRGIIEHLHNGQMNLKEFACYCILLLRADYKTGVAWVRASDFMFDEEISLSSVQRALTGLEEKKYIKRFATAGSKKPYPVLIDKYEIPNGSEEDMKRINAVKSTSWKYPVYEGADEPLRSRWGGDHEANRSRTGGEQDAPIKPEESTTSGPKEVRSKNLEERSEKEEEDMSLRDTLMDSSRAILGVRIMPDDKNWSEIRSLARVYGNDAVAEKFEAWAKSLQTSPGYPLSAFVRIADALLTGKKLASVSPEIGGLINDLAAISDNRVIFNNNQKSALSELLQEHAPADIKSAFTEFWGNIENDEFSVRQAARTFVEGAEQLLSTQSRRREKEAQTQRMLEETTKREQEQAAREREAAEKAQAEIDALIEDEL